MCRGFEGTFRTAVELGSKPSRAGVISPLRFCEMVSSTADLENRRKSIKPSYYWYYNWWRWASRQCAPRRVPAEKQNCGDNEGWLGSSDILLNAISPLNGGINDHVDEWLGSKFGNNDRELNSVHTLEGLVCMAWRSYDIGYESNRSLAWRTMSCRRCRAKSCQASQRAYSLTPE